MSKTVAQGVVPSSETGIFEQLIKMKYDIPNDHINIDLIIKY